jgi:2'-5' RNA ligase
MSKRLFVAIDLSDSTRQFLADLDPDIRGVRWTELDQMHLTLGFFGDVREDIELKLREKLSVIGFGAFFLPVNGVRKLSGSASAKRTRICSKFTSACRKPRWPPASNRS